jgi:putative inorganic carbon (hco3(-)) transporter
LGGSSGEIELDQFYSLNIKEMWRYFKKEHFSFWMICAYLFVEYVRPQAIFPVFDFLPWASVFLILALLGAITDPTVKWVKSPANKWMVLFFIVILLSSFNATVPAISYKKLEFFYTWLIIYFLVINIVNTQKRLFIFLAVFVIASFKISLGLAINWAKRGFSFTSWGLMGPPGFFQNSGELAIQMSVFFPIAYILAAKLKPYVSKRLNYVLMLMPITAAMTILGSSSRGGQLALAAQLILMFYKKLLKPKTLIITVAIFSLAYFVLPEEQKLRFTEAGSDKTSQQRLNYWDAGKEMLNDHPFLGIGYFNFPRYFENYYSHLMLYPYAELPHNIFIQVGSELGYIGLFVYAMLIINCFIRPVKSTGRHAPLDFLPWAMNISIFGFYIAGQFVSVVYYPFMWIHLALVVCVVNVVSKTRNEVGVERSTK